MQSSLPVGVLRGVRRFACALGLSVALHSIALLLASALERGEPRSLPPISEPLVLVLASPGRNGGGGSGGPSGSGPLPGELHLRPTSAEAPEANAELAPGLDAAVPPVRKPAALPARAMDARAAAIEKPDPRTRHATTGGISSSDAPTSAALGGGTGGVGGGTGGVGGGPLAIAYERALAAWLNSHKYYPASLRRRGIAGEGKLRIRIARSGHVLAVDIAAAFPHPSLEVISQDWVKRAEPFPPVPDAIPGDNYVFVVPVGFRLQ